MDTVLDAPGCYERATQTESKSALQGSGLVRTVGPCTQSRVPWAIHLATVQLEMHCQAIGEKVPRVSRGLLSRCWR